MSDEARASSSFADAFTAAFIRLQVTIDRACAAQRAGRDYDWPAQAAAAITTALDWAAADPIAANLLTNEALSAGGQGIARYRRLVDDLARRLYEGREQRPGSGALPPITERALVGGIVFLVAQYLDRGQAAELPEVAPEAIRFVLAPYLGVDEAMRVAARGL